MTSICLFLSRSSGTKDNQLNEKPEMVDLDELIGRIRHHVLVNSLRVSGLFIFLEEINPCYCMQFVIYHHLSPDFIALRLNRLRLELRLLKWKHQRSSDFI